MGPTPTPERALACCAGPPLGSFCCSRGLSSFSCRGDRPEVVDGLALENGNEKQIIK